MDLHVSEPRSLPLGSGLLGTCSKQVSCHVTDQCPGSVQAGTRGSFWDGLELISLSINRQTPSSNIRLLDCTTVLFRLAPAVIQKLFQGRINMPPAKSHVCCWKKKWCWVKTMSFPNKHSIFTLTLATTIQFGWAVWGVDLTLFPEQ